LTENGASEKLGLIGAAEMSLNNHRTVQRKKGAENVSKKDLFERLKGLTGVVKTLKIGI
jgi:hypothetical protein